MSTAVTRFWQRHPSATGSDFACTAFQQSSGDKEAYGAMLPSKMLIITEEIQPRDASGSLHDVTRKIKEQLSHETKNRTTRLLCGSCFSSRSWQ
jgi:hypothetical protein